MTNRDDKLIQEEVDRNFDFFTKSLPALLKDQRGRYVLLRSQTIAGIFDTARDALTAGEKMYPDGLYSIQQVTDTSIDLGYFSHAGSLG